jgi:Mg2+ and Co2+ transporter CorA
MRYFTRAKREEKYVELEQLRETIANYFAVIRPIEEEIDRIEQQIEDYKKLHKIKKVY